MHDDKLKLSRDDFLTAVDELAGGDSTRDEGAPASPERAQDKEMAALYGERIQQAREWKGFTLSEVSYKTGIEQAVLESAEKGQTVLPLGLLIRVAKALSLRLADIISRGEEPFTIVRAGEGKCLERFAEDGAGTHGYEFESLAPKKKSKTMEPFLVTLFPTEYLQPSSHEGQEFLYVLEGEIEVQLEGKAHRLGPGDAIYYDSVDTHLVKASGDKPAKIVAVLKS